MIVKQKDADTVGRRALSVVGLEVLVMAAGPGEHSKRSHLVAKVERDRTVAGADVVAAGREMVEVV